MRIEKVIIENLNSLLGRFEIDLTDRAYAGGLFAIVGPSGAGKTTVLDGICLALYGKTPRIDSISDSHDELMNKGAASCKAEAVFTAGGKRYKSIFVHERAKGSKPFRAVKRELLAQAGDGTWYVAAARIREVDERIEEICGLDYGRFTRSIMLAQFRFAEFLQANSNERAAILEQITDMDIYRRISIAVYERTQHQKQQLAETRSRIGDIMILSESEEAARKEEVTRLEAAAAAHETLKNELAACRAMAQQLQILGEQQEKYKKAKTPLAEEKEKRLLAFKQAEQAEQTQIKKNDELAETLKIVREIDIKAANKADEIKRFDREIADDDDRINANKKAVLDIFKKYEPNASGERYRALYETNDVSAQLRGKAKAELDAAAAMAESIETQISQALAQKDESHWRFRLEALKNALPVAEAAEALKKAQESLTEFKKQQAVWEGEHKAFEQTAKDIEEKYEYAKLNMRFGEERRKLEDGKPCPLCGALHHPSAGEALDDAYFDKAKQNYDEMQRKKDDIKNRMRQIELRIGDLGTLIDEKTRYIAENGALLSAPDEQQETDGITKAIDEIDKRLSAYAQLLKSKSQAAENVAVMTARFGGIDKDVEMIDSRKRNIADAENDKKKKQQRKAQTQTELDVLNAQRQAIFGDMDADAQEAAAKKSLQHIQDEKEQCRNRADQAARALEQNDKDISRTQGEMQTLSLKLKTSYEKTAADAVNVQSISDDDDVTALYGRFMDAAAVLSEQPDADALGSAANALGALISGETARLGSVRQVLRANAESRQTVKTLKSQEKSHRLALEKWEKLNALIGSASGNKFSRIAQSITFDALLRFSNQSLKRMSDRYILVRDEKGQDKPLELAVIDTYQAGEKRPVSNLSGGESFIVSMALALGLSDMSSGAARIDSLFIDEGFASLDEDYMEAALQTLSALGNREGKLIGVISHVEALKARIDVQIEVQRLSGGCSELTGPGVKQFTINN